MAARAIPECAIRTLVLVLLAAATFGAFASVLRAAALRWVLLITMIVLMTASEIGLSQAAPPNSAYNWFPMS